MLFRQPLYFSKCYKSVNCGRIIVVNVLNVALNTVTSVFHVMLYIYYCKYWMIIPCHSMELKNVMNHNYIYKKLKLYSRTLDWIVRILSIIGIPKGGEENKKEVLSSSLKRNYCTLFYAIPEDWYLMRTLVNNSASQAQWNINYKGKYYLCRRQFSCDCP